MQPSRARSFFRKPVMLAIAAVFIAPLMARGGLYALSDKPHSWRDADWSSTGSLPPAADYRPARVLVFTGPTGRWKGVFAVHSWIVLKRENAQSWTRYDVVGWGSPVRKNGWAPDGRWYGNPPTVIADVQGEAADILIPKIEAAVKSYRFNNYGDYRMWPGPNSNTFTAAILRAAPELGVALPPNAIGRDYREGFYAGMTDSGTGFEVSMAGVFGVKLGWVEGVEVNLLGLVAGLDLRHPGVKVPGFGHIGADPNMATALAR